jgi:hypothetical protein
MTGLTNVVGTVVSNLLEPPLSKVSGKVANLGRNGTRIVR